MTDETPRPGGFTGDPGAEGSCCGSAVCRLVVATVWLAVTSTIKLSSLIGD